MLKGDATVKQSRWKLVCCILLLGFAAHAQNSQVSWWGMDMGGGTCGGQNTMLSAVVGDRWIGYTSQGNTAVMGGFMLNPAIWQTVVSMAEHAQIPEAYALYQNYPNPFNPSTTIRFDIPATSMVRLSVFDLLGREVAVLVNEKRNAGVFETKFLNGGVSSGVYFFRLQAGDYAQTRKMILIK
jgi:hypothetical protein